jgi:alpha-1,2-mannosyltransferase
MSAALRRKVSSVDLFAFAVLPALLVAVFTLGAIGHHYAFDFHTYWSAARRALNGRSPYPSPSAVAAAHSTTGDYRFFVYPPPFVLALIPLSVLPFAAAAAVYTALLLGCFVVALRVLEVEDWRCYGTVFLAVPTLFSLRLGEVTPILMLLLALAWRYRDHWPTAGASVGAAVAVKLFLWPLVIWLLVTRRWKAAAAAAVGGSAITALAWTAIGFKGFEEFPALLRALTKLEAGQSYSLVALAERLHLPDPRLTWLVLALPIVGGLVFACRRTTAASFDSYAFSTGVCLALLLTPILWLNFLMLLFVPIALASRRLDVRWALPLALWLAPFQEPAQQPLWRLVIVLGIVLGSTVYLLSGGASPGVHRRRGMPFSAGGSKSGHSVGEAPS